MSHHRATGPSGSRPEPEPTRPPEPEPPKPEASSPQTLGMHDQTTKPAQPRSITRWRAGMIRDLIGWAYRTPRWVVSLVCMYAAGLLFVDAVAHLTDLLRHGLRLYDWAPGWLNWYRSSLAVLDPLAAWLLLRGRRGGVTLACAIMATDLAANWYAIYGIQHSHFVAEPDLQRLTGFAVLILGTAPFIRRYLANRDDLLPVTERDEST
jgi:hypothetical protein